MTDQKAPTGNVTISVETLAAAMASVMKSAGPNAALLTGMSEERLARVRGEFDKPIRQRAIKGHNSVTGSTFTMIVLESRTYKHGRVVRLEDYKLPPGVYKREAEGGLLPDGMPIWFDKASVQPLNDKTPHNAFNKQYKYWMSTVFWHEDLRRICNGMPLRPEYCVEGPKALETPWEDTTLPKDEAAQ
jgi:hypothetical protein